MKQKLYFVKSSKTKIDFEVNYEVENSFYNTQQKLVKGFVRTEKGKITRPAVAEIYFFNDNYFIRSMQLEDFTLKFSEAEYMWNNDVFMGHQEVKYLSF